LITGTEYTLLISYYIHSGKIPCSEFAYAFATHVITYAFNASYDLPELYKAFHNVLRNYNIHNKKTKGPTLMELFTATGEVKRLYLTTRDV
jgi:hypothetical protein